MASEQSSQSHLPPAWPEAADPPPAWARDSSGTGPRLPLPPEEPPGGGTSWQASVPGNGSWQQIFGTSASASPHPRSPDRQPGGDSPQAVPQGSPDPWPSAQPSPPAENGGWGTPQTADSQGWNTAPATENGGWGAAQNTGNGGWDTASTASGGGWNASSATDNGGWGSPPAEPPNHASSPSWPVPPGAGPAPFTGQDPLTSPNPFAGQGHPSSPANPNPFAGQGHPSSPANPNPFANQDPLTSPNPFAGQQEAFRNPLGDGAGPDGPPVWTTAGATAPPGAPAQAPPYDPAQGAPTHGQPHPGQPHPGQPPMQGQSAPPGGHLSRDPSDPNRPFVTAGQISGPKTPPPERQQELWNTVFGDNYQAMDDGQDLDEQGRPVWVFALAGSVAIALVGAVLWAFLAGPLASTEEEAAPAVKPSATAKKPARSQAVGRLPRFPGKASAVAGTLPDQAAAISVARLGTPWRQDQRQSMSISYGFTTRQYVPAGTDSLGKAQFAQVMSGALSPRLKSKYTSPDKLAPVINAVASAGRKKFFPEDNTARKTAQQTLSVNGLAGQLAAYEITSGTSKTTMVVAAVNTGAELPVIVYMSVPDSKKELLPDINTVFKSIRKTTT
ncbi:hypothetical protein [Streptosporangium sp. NBC_01756]|uniref:hypothetical protein n=1 Tax=Streptosporangium sp. NBC_01756 TaxID=2975950 RepID=UPI002DDC313B|nr:hypothetical protein [Streptosporangium sp. NBC_01756]WSC88072.1 hypothetical protein OIE48_07680 [Streptosporangium sp. NBC_01756]